MLVRVTEHSWQRAGLAALQSFLQRLFSKAAERGGANVGQRGNEGAEQKSGWRPPCLWGRDAGTLV